MSASRAASISQSCLPTPEKTTFLRAALWALRDALEFAAGDDVEACSLFGEKAEDGEGGVRFNGVADGVGAVGEGLVEELEAVRDLFGGVDVERGAVFGGEGGEIGSVAVEGPVAVGEGAGIRLGLGGFLRQCSEHVLNSLA